MLWKIVLGVGGLIGSLFLPRLSRQFRGTGCPNCNCRLRSTGVEEGLEKRKVWGKRCIQALKEGIEAELLGGELCWNASQAINSSLVGDFKQDQVESTLNQAHFNKLNKLKKCKSRRYPRHAIDRS